MADQERPTHAHPLEVMSLTLGLLLMVTGLVFAIVEVDISDLSLGWVAFGILGAVGAMTLAAAVRRHRGSRFTRDERLD